MNDAYQAIAELDLEPIKVKLMHKESGEGWSIERANAIEFEYRRFLILMKKYPDEQTAPLVDVDTFWHYHILDTLKYAADCEAVFGYFLHHFPYIGLRGEADEEAHHRVGQRMKELYEETFGEDYIRATAGNDAAYSGIVAPGMEPAAGQTAFSGIVAQGKDQVTAQTAFSGIVAQGKQQVAAQTAFSGIVAQGKDQVTAQTAFSGIVAQGKQQVAAQTAFSGIVAQGKQQVAARTAFSGIVSLPKVAQAGTQTAFSGMATKTAFSGIVAQGSGEQGGTRPTMAGMATAFSGMTTQAGQADAQVAFSGIVNTNPAAFYSVRPRLPATA